MIFIILENNHMTNTIMLVLHDTHKENIDINPTYINYYYYFSQRQIRN